MALKKRLTEEEKYGLSEEEIVAATRWLRKHKTAGIIKDTEVARLYELYLLGEPLSKIAQQYPQYPLGQIALTAALKGWARERDRMLHTLRDRVRAKVVRSVIDQIDFLNAMLAVANIEHLTEMHNYIKDPKNNPKPSMRIESIKDYKEITDIMSKFIYTVMSGLGSNGKGSGGSSKAATFMELMKPSSVSQIGHSSGSSNNNSSVQDSSSTATTTVGSDGQDDTMDISITSLVDSMSSLAPTKEDL